MKIVSSGIPAFPRKVTEIPLQPKEFQKIRNYFEALSKPQNKPSLPLSCAKRLSKEEAPKVPSPYQKPDISEAIEKAKNDAAGNGWLTSARIGDYGITDQKALVEIAKIAAGQDGGGVSAFIEKYGIKSEDDRIAIAKIAAASGGLANAEQMGSVSAYIQNYKIDSADARADIALIAAEHNGYRTAEQIQNYEITDKHAKTEILAAAVKNNSNAIVFAKNFDIENRALFKISYNLIKEEPLLSPVIFDLFESDSLMKLQAGLYANSPKLARQFTDKDSPIAKHNLKHVTFDDASKHSHDKKVRLIAALTDLEMLNPELQKYMLEKNALPKILSLKPPSLGKTVIDDIKTFYQQDREWMTRFQKLNDESGKGIHRLIPNLYLAHFAGRGLDMDQAKDLSLSINKNNLLRKPRYQKIFYPLLHNLEEVDKSFLMTLIDEPGRVYEKMKIAETIIASGHEELINGEDKLDLSRVFNRFFQIDSPVKSFDNFSERFDKLLGFDTAAGASLLSLWQSLQKLPEGERTGALQEAGEFINALMTGTLPELRRAPTPHHSAIKLGKWEKDISKKLPRGWRAEESANPKTLLESLALINESEDPDVNQGLLSILSDTKNRVIAVKDKKGNLRGAAVLKLLIREKTKEPVLFLDKIHTRRPSDEITEIIEELAAKKSRALKLELYTKVEGESTSEPDILSLGTTTRYEHCEATHGPISRGKYKIENPSKY
jgi:hypothetical protein